MRTLLGVPIVAVLLAAAIAQHRPSLVLRGGQLSQHRLLPAGGLRLRPSSSATRS